jgi:hypothetical protein
VAIALLTGIRAARRLSVPALARAGLASLALAVGLAAVARLVDGPAAGPALAPADGLAIGQAGQVAFLGGAAAVGIAGLVAGRRGRGDLVPAGLGVLLAAGILGFAARAPLMWGALAIWSSGLTGGVPAVLVAPALGLAVAGLPLLLRSRPRASVGTAIVLAAGYDLAASGLLLAGLLGLVVASDTEAHE